MKNRGRQIKDITGQRFGKLIVISFYQLKNHRVSWNCLCDCGTQKVIFGQYLKSNHVKSCGCMVKDGRSDETKKKIGLANSISHKGMKYSEEARKNMSESKIGIKHWNWGKKSSIESRKKMSVAQSGEKSHAWQGGLSYEEYPKYFNRMLKRYIRDRDNHTCLECGRLESEIGRKLHIHHIDYNKFNCDSNNLISLCTSCHSKTGFNRESWVKYYLSRLDIFK